MSKVDLLNSEIILFLGPFNLHRIHIINMIVKSINANKDIVRMLDHNSIESIAKWPFACA